MYVDGGYSGKNVSDLAASNDIEMHYTDMTGKKTDDEKISINKFELNEDKTVKQCPAGFEPNKTSYNLKNDQISAHFSKEICADCVFRNKCCLKEQVKANKFSATGLAMQSQYLRDEILENRKENTSMRAAIEGTNSELKRSHGLDNLKVRGIIKVRITTGFKITACNFKRFAKNTLGKLIKNPVFVVY